MGAAYLGDIYFGLWYPVVIALMTVAIGAVFIKERKAIEVDSALRISADSAGKE